MPADEPEGPVSADAGAGEQQDTKQSEPQPSATTAAAPAPADAKATATQQTDAESQASARKRQTKDFEFGGILGEGSYSTVIYAKEPSTGREFAVKMLDKRQIVRERKIKYVNVEKDVLNLIHQHPFIVRLFYTFQDTHSLYFVLELAKNGDLLGYLKRLGRFGHQGAQFYTGEIVEAVKFLHSKGVIHRDLKPENILLDEKYHIKVRSLDSCTLRTWQARRWCD
ncbi:kinase-like domain-containing protein [Entophlyctis helioformis]|nr:kinase-like domain-containing protein [Entophlyctis helioformis]